jgi:DNA-binding response OmpR family regulator
MDEERGVLAWPLRSPAAAGDENTSEDPADYMVLLIDDEIRPDDALVQLLSFEGFNITCEESGRHGLARALVAQSDAILLDLRLRDIPGLTVLPQLPRAPTTPVIVITGWYADSQHELEAKRLGAVDFMRKPLDAAELAVALSSAIAAQVPERRQGVAPPCAGDRTETAMLHLRVVSGDQLAVGELMTRLLMPLQRRLSRSFPRADVDLCADAVEDALLEPRVRNGSIRHSAFPWSCIFSVPPRAT